MCWKTVRNFPKLMIALGVIAGASQPGATQSSAWRDPSPHIVQFVNVAESVQLEVLDWGGKGVPIVLLAGSGLSAHVYDEFAPVLTDIGHVYGITRRGYGNSSHPTTGYDNQQLAADVLEVLDKLRLDRPLLVGHSMAGSELTTIGSEHSDLIRGLLYLDALGDPRDMEASDRRFRKALQNLPTEKTPPPPEEPRSFSGFRDWQLRTNKFALPESELRTIFATNPDGSMGKPVAFANASADVFAGEMKRDYSGIRVPVFALLEFPRFELQPGDPQPKTEEEFDRMFEVNILHAIYVFRWIDNLKRSVPDAHIVNVPNGGHYLFLTKPAEVAKQIRKFVGLIKQN